MGQLQVTDATLLDESGELRRRAFSAKRDVPEELAKDKLPRETLESFMWEIREQPAWRAQADRDADYYDSNQLTPELIQKLKDRGQPPLITNIIKPTIDVTLGMEAKTRTDWKVNPEDDDEAEPDAALALSVKLKHAEIESGADRACSDAYAAEMKAGLGWVEVADDDDPLRPPYRCRYIHRREIFWDWRAQEPDLSDARYLVRRRWTDLELAVAAFPKQAELLRMAINGWHSFDPFLEQNSDLVNGFNAERDTTFYSTDWRDFLRDRVCLYEIWYRKMVSGHIIRLPDGRKIEADLQNPRHAKAILSGAVECFPANYRKLRLAWYAGPHFLADIPTPYPHQHFPYVPFWGYREDLTGVPYGAIRSMVSPQDEVNARKSKQLWLLNSRRVVADSDAVADHNKAAAEVARPNAYIILDKSRKPTSNFTIQDNGELAPAQHQALIESKLEIAQASGIHQPMQGQASSATSGLAINSLIEQGVTTLAEINDNQRFARRQVGTLLFELMRRDLAGRQVKVAVGNGARRRIIVLNQPVVDEKTGEPRIKNNVAKMRASIVLDDMPSTPTFRQQVAAQLMEMVKGLPPELQAAVLDLVIEASDLPNKDDFVERIQKVIGIGGENQQPDPEKIQMAEALKEAQRMIGELSTKLESKDRETAIKAEAARAEDARAREGMRLADERAREEMRLADERAREQLRVDELERAARLRLVHQAQKAASVEASKETDAKVQAHQAKAKAIVEKAKAKPEAKPSKPEPKPAPAAPAAPINLTVVVENKKTGFTIERGADGAMTKVVPAGDGDDKKQSTKKD